MTVQQAYKKVKKLPGRNFLIASYDYKDWWAFLFSDAPPTGLAKIGSRFDLTDKKTGATPSTPLSPLENAEIANKGTPIDITQFN